MTDPVKRTPEENRAYQEARRRAARRLIGAYPEVWRAIFEEELLLIKAERPDAFPDRTPRPRRVIKR